MLLLGHTGITLGITTVLARMRPAAATKPQSNWFLRLAETIDVRILLIGALLPDIIDKPLGHIIFAEALANGRIYAHTLLFPLLLIAGGYWLYRKSRRMWLLLLGLGSFWHIIQDQMWLAPKTLFWPVFGFVFEKHIYDDYLDGIWEALFSNPAVYIPEIIGGLILAWFGVALLRRRRVIAFINRGRV
jgi:inner membrane protein